MHCCRAGGPYLTYPATSRLRPAPETLVLPLDHGADEDQAALRPGRLEALVRRTHARRGQLRTIHRLHAAAADFERVGRSSPPTPICFAQMYSSGTDPADSLPARWSSTQAIVLFACPRPTPAAPRGLAVCTMRRSGRAARLQDWLTMWSARRARSCRSSRCRTDRIVERNVALIRATSPLGEFARRTRFRRLHAPRAGSITSAPADEPVHGLRERVVKEPASWCAVGVYASARHIAIGFDGSVPEVRQLAVSAGTAEGERGQTRTNERIKAHMAPPRDAAAASFAWPVDGPLGRGHDGASSDGRPVRSYPTEAA